MSDVNVTAAACDHHQSSSRSVWSCSSVIASLQLHDDDHDAASRRRSVAPLVLVVLALSAACFVGLLKWKMRDRRRRRRVAGDFSSCDWTAQQLTGTEGQLQHTTVGQKVLRLTLLK